jgi:hypothetical protein
VIEEGRKQTVLNYRPRISVRRMEKNTTRDNGKGTEVGMIFLTIANVGGSKARIIGSHICAEMLKRDEELRIPQYSGGQDIDFRGNEEFKAGDTFETKIVVKNITLTEFLYPTATHMMVVYGYIVYDDGFVKRNTYFYRVNKGKDMRLRKLDPPDEDLEYEY